MTEPEVAGSDPTLIKTFAYQDGDEWVINGHKWFISGARGAKFAMLVARTEEDPEIPQAANSCFIVDLPSRGGTSSATSRPCRAATTTARS
jgi:acyl-CoA dehydrogenase